MPLYDRFDFYVIICLENTHRQFLLAIHTTRCPLLSPSVSFTLQTMPSWHQTCLLPKPDSQGVRQAFPSFPLFPLHLFSSNFLFFGTGSSSDLFLPTPFSPSSSFSFPFLLNGIFPIVGRTIFYVPLPLSLFSLYFLTKRQCRSYAGRPSCLQNLDNCPPYMSGHGPKSFIWLLLWLYVLYVLYVLYFVWWPYRATVRLVDRCHCQHRSSTRQR